MRAEGTVQRVPELSPVLPPTESIFPAGSKPLCTALPYHLTPTQLTTEIISKLDLIKTKHFWASKNTIKI